LFSYTNGAREIFYLSFVADYKIALV